ncbi:MAG: SUMF1/EgtB/PvdO family nonheme iron enzyme [Thermodesulfobacteriota bacterium]
MVTRIIRLLIALLVLGAAAHAAQDRGVTVTVKQSERPDAPDAGLLRLYGASYALVIGIDSYTSGWPRLSNAVKDAALVAEELTKQGFETALKTNLGSRDLEDALETFFVEKGADPDARLFVWFAGHGHTLDGEGFLVPADAPAPSDKIHFKLKAVSLRRFGELVRLAESKHALAIFDSCFSGTVFDTVRAMPPPAVTRHTALPVRQYVSSGDADQTVSDDGRFRRLFVNALEGVERADANQDGYLTGSELGMFLSDRLSNLTQNKQTPRYGKLRDDKWDQGDFVFLVASGGSVTAEGPASAATQDALLSVSANVPGASVYLNGTSIGSAPVSQRAMKPGSYELRVEKAGYQAYRTRVTLSAGRHAELNAYLQEEGPELARLYVDTVPSDARVRMIEPDAEYRPGLELAAGRYQVEVSAEGYVTQQQGVDVSAGQDRYLTVRLVKASGQTKLADLAQVRQALQQAEQDFQRMSRLYEAGALSAAEYNAAKSQLSVADQKVKTLEAALPKGGDKAKSFTNSIGQTFAYIPSGNFTMGSWDSGRDTDETQHSVTLSKSFYLQTTEVTQEQWKQVMGSNPSQFSDCGGSCPVENVSWEEVQEYIRRLNELENRTYRLPTEAEWEYACRAGTKGPFNTKGCLVSTQGGNLANFDGTYTYLSCPTSEFKKKTVPVGIFPPNDWGLYDMHGNVWEWCQDWYGEYQGSATDPKGPSSGSSRVARGGSWYNRARLCRSANRAEKDPTSRYNDIGFRLAFSE